MSKGSGKTKSKANGKKGKQPTEVVAPKGQRVPVPGASVPQRKRPVVGEPSAADPTIVWGFSYLDLEGPWGWDNVSSAEAQTLVKKVQGWETMKQSQMFGSGGNKFIPIQKLCAEAQKRLQEIELDDLDGLWELRVSGAARVWGHRQENVFYPIWWDPNHEVCPSTKK